MEAFHVLRIQKGKEDFSLSVFELFVALLSALKWREKNGRIKLITDSRGKKYIEQLGLYKAWNEVSTLLDGMDLLHLDEVVFWAGAKLYALSKQSAPCAMIDLDFIVWQHMDFMRAGYGAATIHRESVGNDIYPDAAFFHFKDGWCLPSGLDWSVLACNTAFACFYDAALIKNYTEGAFEFMVHADTSDAGLPYMVFAEQRWLAMCAAKMGRKIDSFASLDDLFEGRQEFFTHIWGEKDHFRKNREAADEFCKKCVARIKHDFPQWAEHIRHYSWAAKYF